MQLFFHFGNHIFHPQISFMFLHNGKFCFCKKLSSSLLRCTLFMIATERTFSALLAICLRSIWKLTVLLFRNFRYTKLIVQMILIYFCTRTFSVKKWSEKLHWPHESKINIEIACNLWFNAQVLRASWKQCRNVHNRIKSKNTFVRYWISYSD